MRSDAVAPGNWHGAVIPEADIWRSALEMVKRYKADALLEASARADQALEDGDMGAASTWHRILDAIERKKPAEGATTH